VIEVLHELGEDYIGCMYAAVHKSYTAASKRQSGEVLSEQGEGYTKVTRGIKWLVESALFDLKGTHPAGYGRLKEALETLLTPQPIYDSTKDYQVRQDPMIFWKKDIMGPAIHMFTEGPGCDEAAIE
jgi:hypothetical protein